MRNLVIGDIHGAYKALEQVLERSNYDSGSDRLICLGDYVDGWSESDKVVQKLIDLQEESCGINIYLRGNHDKWCEDWLNFGKKHPYWIPQGGQATFDAYVKSGLVGDVKHAKFFTFLHNYYIDEENRGFVHGGFVSRKGLGYDAYPSDYYWDRDMWELAVLLEGREEEASNKAKRFRKHKEVYIGHTSTCNWKLKKHYPEYNDPNQPKNNNIMVPMKRCNVWNMDTGAGFNGKLTIMDIDTKEYWQSDLVKDLYPNEKGR